VCKNYKLIFLQRAKKSRGGDLMKLATSRPGQSELEITRVGIGTAPIGSTPNWSIYWGPQSESEAIRTIDVALDLGVNWIDTAPFYGWGRAEQIARALGLTRVRRNA
jgi:aryl-alcohol dehydrogenase-like predicted oxidoreductase